MQNTKIRLKDGGNYPSRITFPKRMEWRGVRTMDFQAEISILANWYSWYS